MRQMKLIIATLFLISPFAANADLILTGEWEGEWSGSSITAIFDMVIEQEAGGSITGYFDWTCTTGITCSGREFFAGVFDASILVLTFATTGFADALNLGPSTYMAWVANDGNSMTGTDGNGSGFVWSATKVAEPGTLALLGIGLIGMGLSRRRKIT